MQSFIFKFLLSRFYNLFFSVNIKPESFALQKNERCLFLAAQTEDVFAAAGGTILKNPEKFSIYCLTNGFKEINDTNITYEDKVEIRKKEFNELMEKATVAYYHFFEDVDANRLAMRYDKFKSIILSDYDYIFVPNILEQNRDNKAVTIMLNELLKERPYKKNVKILMYELNSTLAMPNVYVDVEETINNKSEFINNCKSQEKRIHISDTARCLNKFRGISLRKEYAEAFCALDVCDFDKICKMYSL